MKLEKEIYIEHDDQYASLVDVDGNGHISGTLYVT